MNFDAWSFACFWLAVWLIVAALPSWRARKIALLISSYAFYGAWNPPFVLLLIISTAVDFIAGQRIGNSTSATNRRGWLIASLITNLGLLGFFKYGDFLLQNTLIASSQLGWNWQGPAWDIVLPVGISFYTFQSLSYTIDVYRGQQKPSMSALDFAVYVSFFPQLVAGPIVRAGKLLPQLFRRRTVTFDRVMFGLSVALVGLFMKVFLADTVFAPAADKLFLAPQAADAALVWAGAFAFGGQIYCDFAGYSIMAVGVASTFGFRLPWNFHSPYASLSIREYWRRWHITLSNWLKDYVYIPLGGNRNARWVTDRNLFLTMLIGGLWHGAAWHFVIWGALHGLYMVGERIIAPKAPRTFIGTWAGLAWTLFALTVGWVLFRAPTTHDMTTMLGAMFSLNWNLSQIDTAVQLAIVAKLVLIAVHWLTRNRSLTTLIRRAPLWSKILAGGLMLGLLLISPTGERPFIYFQF